VRLTTKEVKDILLTFKKVFKDGNIYLFGSRTDDSKKGGDIDLYIQSKNKDNLIDKKIDFLIELKQKLGDQKIDVVISKNINRPIEQEALNKGIKLNYKVINIQKYINECQKHKLRINKSHLEVKDIFPLSSLRYKDLNDLEIQAIDQYLFRFAKLQDTIGEKLFKIIVSQYVENVEELTFLDILNKLEKIEILSSVNIWKKLRAIRNNISHQYDDEPEEMAEALNEIFAYKEELLDIFNNIEKFYKKNEIK
jgi:predicted nucleotidyltransferase